MIRNRTYLIWLTLFISLFIQIIPWPTSYNMIKPHLVLLILAYWLIALPHSANIITAFIVGAILDLCTGTVLGVHAFACVVIAYFLISNFQLIRNLALWQQSFIIFLISICYNFLLFIFEMTIYHTIDLSPMFFLSSCADSILWSVIYLLLRHIRRRFAIK